MSSEMYVALSIALSHGVPIALGVYQLYQLNRDTPGKSRDEEHAAPSPGPAPDAELPPLPPCLIPKLPERPAGERPRVLEPA